MNISDKNPLGIWPLQLGQSSQPSLTLSSAQDSYQLESDDDRYTQSYPYKQVDTNWVKWVNHVDANIFDNSKFDTKKKDEEKI
jgi:hypothetical protein